MYKCFICDGNGSWKDDGDRRVLGINDLVLKACVNIHGSTLLAAVVSMGCIPVFIVKLGSLNAN